MFPCEASQLSADTLPKVMFARHNRCVDSEEQPETMLH